jgi:hypothetical protein
MTTARLLRSATVLAVLFCAACPYLYLKPIFNGKNLRGWFIAETSVHGNTMAWDVVNRRIEGMQDMPGNGGLLLTKKTYGDFYVEAEVMPDAGMDSGLFLRSTADGQSYQITIDLVENGTVGSIFGEQLGTGFLYRFDDWQDFYNVADWNKIAATIEGNPPLINVWLNGEHVVTFQDDEVRLPDTGHIGLQVHGGEQFDGFKMRARRLFVKPLH